MLKKLLILILTINLVSCQSQTSKNYADKLKICLPSNDIEILNNATEHFEYKLIELYGNENLNQNYLKFLSAMSQPNLAPEFPRDFFVNSKSTQILNDLFSSGTSTGIWIAYEEGDSEFEETIQITSMSDETEPEKEELKIDVLNPNGEYLKCLVKENETKIMNDVLTRMSEIGGLSPSLTSRALKNNLTESDFDNGLNKVAVAIGFYYDIVKLINDNQK
jgi:hypothetical protein